MISRQLMRPNNADPKAVCCEPVFPANKEDTAAPPPLVMAPAMTAEAALV
jgi:hypothetical protein